MAKSRRKEKTPPVRRVRNRSRLRLVGPLVAGAIAIVAVIIIVAKRAGTKDNAPLVAFAPPPSAPADTIERDDFVGAETCGSCHQAQLSAWSASTHGRAGQAPPRDLLLRQFDGKPIRFRDASVEPRMSGGHYERSEEHTSE